MHWSRGYCFSDWWKWERNTNVWLLRGFFYNLILFFILLLLLLFFLLWWYPSICADPSSFHHFRYRESSFVAGDLIQTITKPWIFQVTGLLLLEFNFFQELYGLYTVYLCLESTASIKFNYFPVQLYIEGDFKTRAAAIKFNYFPLRLA